MRKNYRAFLFVLCLFHFFHTAIVVAEDSSLSPQISVSVNPSSTQEGESVSFRIAIEIQSTDSIQAPSFSAPDFDIVGQTNSIDIVTNMINGKFIPKRKNNYTFLLYPKKTGKLSIKNIVVQIAGKQFKAKDLEVVVEKGNRRSQAPAIAQNNNSEEDEEDSIDQASDPSQYTNSKANFTLNSDFTVHLHVTKNNVFVGEPVIAEYYLYDFGNLTRVDIKKWPTFNGFWKEDLEIPTRFDFQEEYINGRRVRKALLGRFALYPLKPGKIEISKLIVDGSFITNNSGGRANDPFANFFGVRTLRQAAHASQTEYIQANALPTQNKPNSFNGAVGKFSISLTSNKTNAKVNEPINLKFSVSGIGNFSSIEAPNFSYPDGLELYESNTNAQASAPRGVSADLRKTVSFDILLIPRKPGNFSIPNYAWTYFDVDTKSYKTLNTQPINITISGEALPAAPTPQPQIQAVTAPEVKSEPSYIKPADEIFKKKYFNSSSVLYFLFYTFLLLNIIFWSILLLKKLPTLKGKAKSILSNPSSSRLIKNSLLQLDKSINESKIRYSDIEAVVYIALESIINRTIRGLTIQEIQDACIEVNISATTTDRITTILKKCQENSFAPSSQIDKAVFYSSVEELKSILHELKIF